MTIATFKSAVYFAGNSTNDLASICKRFETAFSLPPFDLDREDSWDYGKSEGDKFAFNVTKTDRTGLIASWMKNAPKDSNVQVIFMFNGERPPIELSELKDRIGKSVGASVIDYAK